MNNTPRITLEHVQAQVASAQYHVFPGTTVTVCCLALRNGFNAIGHSACVSPELYDKDIGEQIAFKNALEKIWQLEGYLLAEWLWLERQQGVGIQMAEGGGIAPVNVGSEPVAVPHGHTAFAAAPSVGPLEAQDGIISGTGGDFAGAGASGSWEAPPEACNPASDPPAASAGDSCGPSDYQI